MFADSRKGLLWLTDKIYESFFHSLFDQQHGSTSKLDVFPLYVHIPFPVNSL